MFRTGSHIHRKNRRASLYVEEYLHPRDRDAQHATGCTRVGFYRVFPDGKLIEFDETRTIFENPSKRETEDYITGRFG